MEQSEKKGLIEQLKTAHFYLSAERPTEIFFHAPSGLKDALMFFLKGSVIEESFDGHGLYRVAGSEASKFILAMRDAGQEILSLEELEIFMTQMDARERRL